MALWHGAYGEARTIWNASLAGYESLGNAGGRTRAHHVLGTLEMALGDYVAAKHHFQTSLELARATANPWDIGSSLFNLESYGASQARQLMPSRCAAESATVTRDRRSLRDRNALNSLGLVRAEQADYAGAHYCRQQPATLRDAQRYSRACAGACRARSCADVTDKDDAAHETSAPVCVSLSNIELCRSLCRRCCSSRCCCAMMSRPGLPADPEVVLQHPACEQHGRLSAERLRRG